jgi:ABC-type sugar transport system permease subunit
VANTLAYAAAVVVVAQTLAFGLAMLLNARVRGRGVFRTLAFLPHVTATAAAALAFVLLLDPRFGPLAALYDAFGVDGPRWLSNGLLALAAMAMVGIWKEIGFASLFFLAGLQNLPRECHEAAVLDGASAWQRLRYVTVPLMSPVILFLLVTGTIAACKAFDVVAMMTEGGPVYPDSSTYVYHLYTTAFRRFEAGYASAMAVVFFVLMTGVAVAQFRIARRHVHYEG